MKPSHIQVLIKKDQMKLEEKVIYWLFTYSFNNILGVMNLLWISSKKLALAGNIFSKRWREKSLKQ